MPSRRAQRIVQQNLDLDQWRLKRGLIDPRTGDLTKEGVTRQERRFAGRITSPMWTPEVEPIEGEDRGVICKSAGGIRCFAQDGPDDLNLRICHSCNDLRNHDLMKEKETFERGALAAKMKTWLHLKNRSPATRRI